VTLPSGSDTTLCQTGPMEADFSPVADGIELLDTGMAGQWELNAVYLMTAEEPALVEAGPGADTERIAAALTRRGLGPQDLAHVVVTHIHLDHAGGAGSLLRRFPRADVWVHERGAVHLADPERLVASTVRTYGEDRMRAFFGTTLPVDPGRIRVVSDADAIGLGDRSLEVLYTPGHASHHVAFTDSATGTVFTGEAIGSHLPWVDVYRPALPPPEVDVEAALASIDRIRRRAGAGSLMTSHFGPIADAPEGCDRAASRIRAWSETVRRLSARTDDVDRIAATLREQAAAEHLEDAGTPIDLARYDAIGSIRMNAAGLERYWRKRREREAADPAAQPS
jgi:glyoxylase-like metal-dependent hydrolase (beta-lactamase superfamily II)